MEINKQAVESLKTLLTSGNKPENWEQLWNKFVNALNLSPAMSTVPENFAFLNFYLKYLQKIIPGIEFSIVGLPSGNEHLVIIQVDDRVLCSINITNLTLSYNES